MPISKTPKKSEFGATEAGGALGEKSNQVLINFLYKSTLAISCTAFVRLCRYLKHQRNPNLELPKPKTTSGLFPGGALGEKSNQVLINFHCESTLAISCNAFVRLCRYLKHRINPNLELPKPNTTSGFFPDGALGEKSSQVLINFPCESTLAISCTVFVRLRRYLKHQRNPNLELPKPKTTSGLFPDGALGEKSSQVLINFPCESTLAISCNAFVRLCRYLKHQRNPNLELPKPKTTS